MSHATKNYSDDFKASCLAALAVNGGNLARTAKQLGVPRNTLAEWEAGRLADGVAARCEPRKLDLAGGVERYLDAAVGHMAARLRGSETPDYSDVAVSFGIVVDKPLLLRGDPLSITSDESATAQPDLTKLSRDELVTLADLHAKARGEAVEHAADLDEPVVVTADDEPGPAGMQPAG